MSKYLIINADDFGMCRGANLAVMDLLTDPNSALTSSTIMAPCGWAVEACDFAKKNPQLAIGVHWTFTSEWGRYRWAPVSHSNTESLRDEDGYMFHESNQFEDSADLDEVEAECRAQIELCKKLGLNPSHVDNHMGSIYGIETGRFELLNVAFDVASEYGLPFRFPGRFTEDQLNNTMLDIKVDKNLIMGLFGNIVEYANEKGVVIPDYLMPSEWNGPQNDSYENFKEYIYDLYKSFPDDGVTETYMHPSIETDDLKGTTSLWQRRVWEYQLLKDPQTKQHIESCGIKLINYRDLAELKK
ncbi:MAG: polysaccharide deacetylase family protein [Ruminococcus sp.]|nr:polysaccharide deacetylase family protein [Candidatus Copronaster equi]